MIPRHDITDDQIRTYIKDNLARFKVPRDIRFVEELPRTPTGKLAKARLRDAYRGG